MKLAIIILVGGGDVDGCGSIRRERRPWMLESKYAVDWDVQLKRKHG